MEDPSSSSYAGMDSPQLLRRRSLSSSLILMVDNQQGTRRRRSCEGRFSRTAVLLIGFQNDYFAPDGILRNVVQNSASAVLQRAVRLVERLQNTSVLLIATPIVFTKGYSELIEPSGILKAIKDLSAFREGSPGSEMVPELTRFASRILVVPGKRGLNAFTGTALGSILREEGVTDVVLCGAVTSVCIDSTGRAAHEQGFRVHHLSDASCGRTELEQEHYIREIFPLYAEVHTAERVANEILEAEAKLARSGTQYRPPSRGRAIAPPAALSPAPIIAGAGAAFVGEAPRRRGLFEQTAVILLCYQNDYFAKDGAMRSIVGHACDEVLARTVRFVSRVAPLDQVLLLASRLVFTDDCEEQEQPSYYLQRIYEKKAFRRDTRGCELVPELARHTPPVQVLPGVTQFNAFTGTELEVALRNAGVSDVMLCGCVTSICVDSTGRAAHERGFRVHIVEDCTCARSDFEQRHYIETVFPLYAQSIRPAADMAEAIVSAARSRSPKKMSSLRMSRENSSRLREGEDGQSRQASVRSLLSVRTRSPSPWRSEPAFKHTAVLLIGYQNDYFAEDGVLRSVIESSREEVLQRTVGLVNRLRDTGVLLVATPIVFTPDYSELVEPSGILKAIKAAGAFRAGTPGSETVPELLQFGERILTVPGRRGLNAFMGTGLESILSQEGVTDVVLCGAVTSVCIDSTGRSAHERGFRVHQLSDCTCGRTVVEQRHYVEEIFPLYANVCTTEEALDQILVAERAQVTDSKSALRRVKAVAGIGKFQQALAISPGPVSEVTSFERTAIVLLGFQNDFFSPSGALHGLVAHSSAEVLVRTVELLNSLIDTDTMYIATPNAFSEGQNEARRPTGLIKNFVEKGAFREGSQGAQLVSELSMLGHRMTQLSGKSGLNAFAGTDLFRVLQDAGIVDVILCGALTSACIDSAGRAAHERGFRVHIVQDCTCGRSPQEQEQYVKDIFPLYASSVDPATPLAARIREAWRQRRHRSRQDSVRPSSVVVTSPQASADSTDGGDIYGLPSDTSLLGTAVTCALRSDASLSTPSWQVKQMSSVDSTGSNFVPTRKELAKHLRRMETSEPFQRTAVLLIGYQNDYFAEDGILRGFFEEGFVDSVLANTARLLDRLKHTGVLIISTPITFTPDYSELIDPSGILKAIKTAGAFKVGTVGCETIPSIMNLGERVATIPGKRGFNAFSGTSLESVLYQAEITDVVFCGAVTSICIDSTGRAAHDRGFRVHHVSDCICARTTFEQRYYLEEVFPLYADVTTTDEVVRCIEEVERSRKPEPNKYCEPDILSPAHKVCELPQAKIQGEADFARTAVILLGYQKEYFWLAGALHHTLETSAYSQVLLKTEELLDEIKETNVLIIATPFQFSSSHAELGQQPTGFMKTIKDAGAFTANTLGVELVPEVEKLGDRVKILPGKRTLNAFVGTYLEVLLREAKITDVVLCGALTSACVDSTGRAAHERGFRVHIAEDCTCGRTVDDQRHYISEIFPLYARSIASAEQLAELINEAESQKDETDARYSMAADALFQSFGDDRNYWSRLSSLESPEPSGERLTSPALLPGPDPRNVVSLMTVDDVKEWMRRHPDKTGEIKEFHDELNVQIQHRLVEKAAFLQRRLSHRENDSRSNSSRIKHVRSHDPKQNPGVNLTFLSHVKKEACSTARLLKLMFKRIIRKNNDVPKIFLDSDDLVQLPMLLQQVETCEIITVVLTRSIFSRPWIMCELCTAFRHNVPVLCVGIDGQDLGLDVNHPLDPQVQKWLTKDCMAIVKKNGFLESEVVEAIKHAFSAPRLPFTADGPSSVQWAQVRDIAVKFPGVEMAVPDPVATFCHCEAKVDRWGVYLAYHRGEDTTIAHVVKLMLQMALEQVSRDSAPVFLDTDNLSSVDEMMHKVSRSDNMVVLLSKETLQRPYVVAEMVCAYKCEVHMVPVRCTTDFDFSQYVSEEFYYTLSEKFDDSAKQFFKDRMITFADIGRSFRKLFNTIAGMFLPSSSEEIMQSYICEIMRRLHFAKTTAAAENEDADSDSGLDDLVMTFRRSKTEPSFHSS